MTIKFRVIVIKLVGTKTTLPDHKVVKFELFKLDYQAQSGKFKQAACNRFRASFNQFLFIIRILFILNKIMLR